MIPVSDENPTRSIPCVNWALIIVNVGMFVYTMMNGSLVSQSLSSNY